MFAKISLFSGENCGYINLFKENHTELFADAQPIPTYMFILYKLPNYLIWINVKKILCVKIFI